MTKWLIDTIIESDEAYKEQLKGSEMVVMLDELMYFPSDWGEFVMLAVGRNAEGGEINSGRSHLVTLDDEATQVAFKIITKGQMELIIVGQPKRDNLIWNLLSVPNKDGTSIFIGGENFRLFCDEKNIYYTTLESEDEEGPLLSSSDLRYQKRDGEDCRTPINREAAVYAWEKEEGTHAH